MSWYAIPLLFSFFNSTVYAGLLFFRAAREGRAADYYLGGLLQAGAILLLPYTLGFLDIHILWRELLFFPTETGYLMGPFMYFYLRAQTRSDFRLQSWDYWHFVPFLLYTLYHLIVFAQGPAFVHRWLNQYDIPYINPVLNMLVITACYAYLYVNLRYLARYRTWLQNEYADAAPFTLTWYYLFHWLLFLGISTSLFFNLAYLAGWQMNYRESWWEYLFISLILYIVCIAGYQQTRPKSMRFEEKPPQKKRDDSLPPPQKPDKVTPDSYFKKKLEALMDEEKLFRDPELNLTALARHLGTSRQEASAQINRIYQKNFNAWINDFRVREFQNLLQDPAYQHLSLLGLAMECGFNSKSTFNRAFKERVGVSPLGYQKGL